MNQELFVGHISTVQAGLSGAYCLTPVPKKKAHFSWISSNPEQSEGWRVNFRNHRNLTRSLNEPFSLSVQLKQGFVETCLHFHIKDTEVSVSPPSLSIIDSLPFHVSSEPASAGIPSMTCWRPGNDASPTRSDESPVPVREAVWRHQRWTLSRWPIVLYLNLSSLISLCFPASSRSKTRPLLLSLHLHGCWCTHMESPGDYALLGFAHETPVCPDLGLSPVTKARLCSCDQ